MGRLLGSSQGEFQAPCAGGATPRRCSLSMVTAVRIRATKRLPSGPCVPKDVLRSTAARQSLQAGTSR